MISPLIMHATAALLTLWLGCLVCWATFHVARAVLRRRRP